MKINNSKYKAWNWKHITMLHWMINPELAIIKQKEKFSKPLELTLTEYTWWKTGIEMGVGVYIPGFIWNLIDDTWVEDQSLVGSILAGLVFDYVMKAILGPSKPSEYKKRKVQKKG